MNNYTLTTSSANYSDLIVVKALGVDEVIPILKSYGFRDSDFTYDYNESSFADCYIPPMQDNENIIQELSKDFKAVYVYEKERKYQVICGFEIENANHFEDIEFKSLEFLKGLLKLNLPKGFIKLIYDKLNKKLIELEKNNTREQLLPNIHKMDRDEMLNYISSNRVRKYTIEHLRDILKDEVNDKIKWLQKDIDELKEKIKCLSW